VLEPFPTDTGDSLLPFDFNAARKRLAYVLIASVLVPILLGSAYAVHTYRRAMTETRESPDRLS